MYAIRSYYDVTNYERHVVAFSDGFQMVNQN